MPHARHSLPRLVITLLLMASCTLVEVGCRRRTETAAKEEFKLGDLVEPFDVPSSEALEQVEWVDQPVLSGMNLLRQELAKEAEEKGEPIPAEEALTLKNDSPEANEKILRSLGQLPPEDGTGVDYEARLLRHVAGDLKSSNPIKYSSVTEGEYSSHTAFGYISFDRHFEYFAPQETVVSWQKSKDNMMDKIVLRDDLTWSDGKPITAHDIEFTFKLIMSSQVIVPAVRTGTDELAAVKAYDDHTVVFFHKEPLVTNTQNVLIIPVPKHIYEKSVFEDPTLERSAHHRKYEETPVVGGPYEMVKRIRNQEFILRRREGYYMHKGKQVRDKPHFAEIRVKNVEDVNVALVALKKGDLEEMVLSPEQWIDQTSGDDFYARNTKVTDLEWVEFHFVWNQQTPYFSDKRVRWAMSHAMDYEELLNTLCYGLYQPSQGAFHPTSWMFPEDGPEPMKQDLDKARQLLDEAGWTDSDNDGIRDKTIGGKKVKFEFTLLSNQTDTSDKVCTLMRECLNKIGVVCNVSKTEFTALVEKLQTKKFQASFGGWGTGTDPDTTSNIFATGENRNYGDFSDPRVDELFEAGKREPDREKRAAIYAEIHTRLWDEQPYTWLYYRNSFYAFNKKLRGYNFSPRGPYSYSPGFEAIYVPAAAQ
jgi:peptide/nickel transport system substrate-binding protein